MSETSMPSETSEEPSVEEPVKSLKNRILLVLGILTIALIISNVYVFLTFNDQINQLTEDKTSLQTQVTNLTEIVNLNKTTIMVNNLTVGQPANSYTSFPNTTQYAGYIKVIIHNSDTSNTYVRLKYNSYNVIFDQTIIVGSGGTAVFPVLPAQNIDLRVGNTNTIDDAQERITVIFYY